MKYESQDCHRASGAMDNASDYGSEDSRFDSWLARTFSSTLQKHNIYAGLQMTLYFAMLTRQMHHLSTFSSLPSYQALYYLQYE